MTDSQRIPQRLPKDLEYSPRRLAAALAAQAAGGDRRDELLRAVGLA